MYTTGSEIPGADPSRLNYFLKVTVDEEIKIRHPSEETQVNQIPAGFVPFKDCF